MLRRSMVRRASAPGAVARRALTWTEMHGFDLVSVRPIEELHLVAYELSHRVTGTPYYHIDSDDSNNTFCIGFRTPAMNSRGTSHVLEHTVLCGSKKYPVRDPFFMMLRRSLSTFMNAMTGADYTLYPFATTNRQDFANLLDVYVDAVFHPLLREEDFRQEGHRVELAPPDTTGVRRLIHNGVVFNEMRGVVSDPNQHFAHSLMRVMLPHTHYEHVSGGYPPDVLRLTYDELVSFHRRHYHPSNSIVLTYGNQHPAEHMRRLNESFSQFERQAVVDVPTLSEAYRFPQPKEVRLEGPLEAMGNPTRQKRITVSYGIPQARNELEDVVALSVLDSLLSSGPSSPMFKSLIESQIGTEYTPMRGYAYYLSTPIMSYGVAGVDENRPDVEREVLDAVTKTLETVQRDGFDERRVRSVIFQEELQQRHRAADYGVHLCTGLCAMGLCRASNKPLDFINWLPHLRRIGANAAALLLPRVSSELVHNPHRAVVSVTANKDFLDGLRDELHGMEDHLNAEATEAHKASVEEKTAQWLERVRAPQPVDALPTLGMEDIPRMAFAEPPAVRCAQNGAIATMGYPTNGLVYVHGLIPFAVDVAAAVASGDVSRLPANLPLLETLLGHTGAGPYSFKDHSIEMELVCGGFTFSPMVNESYVSKGTSIAGTTYGFYTTKERLQDALKLLRVTILEPRDDVTDAEVYARTLSRVKAACSNTIHGLQHHGNRIAVMNAVSRLTPRGAVREGWWGLSQSRHASALLEALQGTEKEGVHETVASLLREYRVLCESLVKGLSSGFVWATCEESHRGEVEQLLGAFLSAFPTGHAARPTHLPALPPTVGPGGLNRVKEVLRIDTSFAGMAIPNQLDWRHPDQAAVRVACQLLSNEYLHRRIREEGGAYGSGSSPTLLGEVGGITMSSYRDPTPETTIEAFEGAAAWLGEAGNITQTRVDEAKLRLFSTIDSPYAADTFGESYFYNDVNQELKQSMREELLRITPRQIVDVANYFTAGSGTQICVLAPEAPEA